MNQKIKPKILGKKIYHFPLVDSTNKVAFFLAERGEEEGTVVLADRQLRGEGCRGKKWFSPIGGLWFSLILRPPCLPESTSVYTLMGAVAVTKAIKEISSSCPVYISLPNDVYVKGKKIGGVMCKTKLRGEKLEFAILGIGVNLYIKRFPSSLKDIATSLLLETSQVVSPSFFLDLVLDILEEEYFNINLGFSANVKGER